MPIFNIQRKGSFKLSIFSNNFQSFRDFPSAFDVIFHHNYFEILHDTSYSTPVTNLNLAIPAGRIVAIALKRRFRVGKVDTSGLFDMLEQWAYGAVDGSSLKFRDYKFHGAWAMIKKQGALNSTVHLF